jgi:endonuclease/exonuclease/phosphatase (EEP) superfamily protein YafD
MIAGDFNTPWSSIDRSDNKKSAKIHQN